MHLHRFSATDIKFTFSIGVVVKKYIYFLLAIICASLTPFPLASAPSEPIANYQVLFSPDDNVANELISLIKKEKKSIKAAVYALMHQGIAKALIDAKERGVHVEVIVDPCSIKARAPIHKMKQAHIPIFVWNPPAKYKAKNGKRIRERKSLMHDKFCILGETRVWTGSFNFTFQATSSNRENVVVLESAKVALSYLEEFEKLKKTGCIPLGSYLANHRG